MEDSLVVEEGMLVKFPSFFLPLVSFTFSSCWKVLFTKKALNNHIIEMHKDPTS